VSELKIDFHPYGAAQHCRYRQHPPRGKPQGGFNSSLRIEGSAFFKFVKKPLEKGK
jgi:hypothetical protein